MLSKSFLGNFQSYCLTYFFNTHSFPGRIFENSYLIFNVDNRIGKSNLYLVEWSAAAIKPAVARPLSLREVFTIRTGTLLEIMNYNVKVVCCPSFYSAYLKFYFGAGSTICLCRRARRTSKP